jgi:hypothetical protein
MKKFSYLSFMSIFALVSSCASITDVVDDDVYVMKGPALPIGESLDDETAYSTYKYKKDRTNTESRYYYDQNSRFSDQYMYPNYGYGMSNFGNRNPMQWVFIPGRGWTLSYGPTFGYNPYGMGNYYGYNSFGYDPFFDPYYDPFYNPYGNPYCYGNGFYSNHWGNNPWGWNNGWGGNTWGNNGWNNGWGGNNWGNNNGWNNNPNPGGNGTTKPNHHTGPRGSFGGGGVSSRPSAAPGVIKIGQNTNSNTTVSAFDRGSKNTLTSSKPVGKDDVINKRPAVNTNTSPSSTVSNTKNFNKPGQVSTNTPVNRNTGSSSQGTSTSPSRTSGGSGNTVSPSRNSGGSGGGSVSPSRNSGGSGGGSVSPSRNSGGSGGGSVSPSRNSGGSGGGSSSPSRGSSTGGGSSSGGRRP